MGTGKILIDDSIDDEHIDMSLTKDQAASLHVVLIHGLHQVDAHYTKAKEILQELKKDQQKNLNDIKLIEEQINLMMICHKNAKIVVKELERIIKELEKPKSKIIIPKPHF